MNFKLILILILATIAVVFVAQNFAIVEIVFLFWKTSMSTALLIFFTLMTGFILGWSLHSYFAYRKKSRDETIYLH